MHGGNALEVETTEKTKLLGELDVSVTFVEFVNTTSDVNKFLFTGEERVAISTDTNALFFSGGINIPNFAASANHFGRTEIRMNIFFHDSETLLKL